MTFPLNGYDFIWASPPCQGHTPMNNDKSRHDATMLRRMRERLECQGTPWALENVVSKSSRAAMGSDAVVLCGSMFDLGYCGDYDRVSQSSTTFYQLQRHRLVLTGGFKLWPPACEHTEPVVGVYGGHARCRAAKHGGRGTRDPWDHRAVASEALEIDWMTLDELSEAIPPAYSKFVAEQLR